MATGIEFDLPLEALDGGLLGSQAEAASEPNRVTAIEKCVEFAKRVLRPEGEHNAA